MKNKDYSPLPRWWERRTRHKLRVRIASWALIGALIGLSMLLAWVMMGCATVAVVDGNINFSKYINSTKLDMTHTEHVEYSSGIYLNTNLTPNLVLDGIPLNFKPFLDIKVDFRNKISDGHFFPISGDFGGGLGLTTGQWELIFKGSSIHSFDKDATDIPIENYNTITIKFNFN